MQNQNLKPNNLIQDDGRFKEKAKEQFSKLKSLVETGISASEDYIQKNPKKVLWRGTTALAFTFMFGYVVGTNKISDNMVASVNSNMSAINRQNFEILDTLKDLATTQYNISQRVDKLERQSKSRLDNLENKVQVNEAVKKGEEHVKKMEKKRGLKKFFLWNLF